MSDVIDWSKAPEGATHYLPEKNKDCHPLWLKINEGLVINAGYIGNRHWAHSYSSASQPSTDLSLAIPRKQAPWLGEGLPPVGAVCEMQDCQGAWVNVTIIANHAGFAHGWDSVHECAYFSPHAYEFRPVRTPEQISADEREATIKAMARVLGVVASDEYVAATAMYDAGYRKQ